MFSTIDCLEDFATTMDWKFLIQQFVTSEDIHKSADVIESWRHPWNPDFHIYMGNENRKLNTYKQILLKSWFSSFASIQFDVKRMLSS